MPRKLTSGRVVLDDFTKGEVERVTVELKKVEPCLRFSPSQLVSHIVSQYIKNSFESDKSELIKKFFNSKEYLKSILRDAKSPDEITSGLKTVLSKFSSDDFQKKNRKKGQTAEVVKDVE